MGGLPKKAFELKKRAISESIVVDGGALLFKQPTPLKAQGRLQAEIQAKGIIKAYNSMDYDAVAISAFDLAGGLNFFQSIKTLSTFPWLSANLLRQADKEPLFKSHIILNRNGMKIAVIGLTGIHILPDIKDVFILDWQETLPQLCNKLSEQCDLLILLSSMSNQENQKICKTVPEINVLIQAGIRTAKQAPVLINKTLACQTAKQGKNLGKLAVNRHKGQGWETDDTKQLLTKKRTRDRLHWQLKKMEARGKPEELDKTRPGFLERYQNLLSRVQGLDESIDLMETKEQKSPTGSTYKNHFIAMKNTLRDEPEVLKIVNETKRRVNLEGKKLAKSIREMRNYAGSPTCRECHPHRFVQWQLSRHGQAFQTLINKEQQFNINCLPCHVTGISTDNGSLALTLSDSLKNVGCESCHGPGKKHTVNQEKGSLISTPSQKTCLACHNEEHDDSFDYEKDLRRLNCRPENK